MSSLLTRLLAIVRRAPSTTTCAVSPESRPIPQFVRPDGGLDDDALTRQCRAFWDARAKEAIHQSAVLLSALRVLVPGAVAIGWEEDGEYDDAGGMATTLVSLTLTVQRHDGTRIDLTLPDYSDLACDEFSYWSTGDDIYADIEDELPEGAPPLEDAERERRFYAYLAQHHGLERVTDLAALRVLASIVVGLVDVTRATESWRLQVPDAAWAHLPPLPPPAATPTPSLPRAA
jgi:hypothetical protein